MRIVQLGGGTMKIGAQIGVLASGSTEEAIAKVSNTGLQGIEVFDFNIAPHYKAPELFSRRLHEANVELSGVYFISDNFIDKEKEDLVIDKAEEACLFMKEVGCSHLVLNGGINRKDDYAFTNEDFRQMACIANRLGELCNRMGIRAVLHPHFGCMIETRADLDRLLESGLDRELVGLCVHAAHQLRKGSDPYDIGSAGLF
jgi:sugar phosphate isomerase/epimerase